MHQQNRKYGTVRLDPPIRERGGGGVAYLFDGDRWFPTCVFIENREANYPRRIDIWMEKSRYEFAFF